MKYFPYLLIFFSIVVISCKTDEKTLIPAVIEKTPTVLVKEVSDSTYRTITLNAEVTDEGFSAATDRGFVYSLSNVNPSVSDTKLSSGYGKGAYSVILDKLPVNTKYYYRAFSTNSKGTSYSDTKTFNTVVVVEVKSKTGRIWMDRNLGASQAANSLTDEKAIGDLYQWGRPRDGHQLRTSGTTSILSNTDVPGNSNFIVATIINGSFNVRDWNNSPNGNLWQGVNGKNNVCPTGFRLPTITEWEQEIKFWSSQDIDGSFKSELKLIGGTSRIPDGRIFISSSNYWSSTVTESTDGKNNYLNPNYLWINSRKTNPIVNASTSSTGTISGFSVRCIKD